jgi:putative endonuclease
MAHMTVSPKSTKYKEWKLVYFEVTSQIEGAIAREKQLKAGPRRRKTELIESTNPRWRDLFHDLLNGV